MAGAAEGAGRLDVTGDRAGKAVAGLATGSSRFETDGARAKAARSDAWVAPRRWRRRRPTAPDWERRRRGGGRNRGGSRAWRGAAGWRCLRRHALAGLVRRAGAARRDPRSG